MEFNGSSSSHLFTWAASLTLIAVLHSANAGKDNVDFFCVFELEPGSEALKTLQIIFLTHPHVWTVFLLSHLRPSPSASTDVFFHSEGELRDTMLH